MLHVVELVGGEEYGSPGGGALADQLEDVLLTKGIEAAGRLVEDQQLGARAECRDEADLLLVPFREVADPPVQIELEPLGELVDDLPVDAAAEPTEVGDERERGATGRKLQLSREVARDPAHLHALRVGVEPGDGSPPACRSDEIDQQTDRGRLPCPVRAEVPEDLALLDP